MVTGKTFHCLGIWSVTCWSSRRPQLDFLVVVRALRSRRPQQLNQITFCSLFVHTFEFTHNGNLWGFNQLADSKRLWSLISHPIIIYFQTRPVVKPVEQLSPPEIVEEAVTVTQSSNQQSALPTEQKRVSSGIVLDVLVFKKFKWYPIFLKDECEQSKRGRKWLSLYPMWNSNRKCLILDHQGSGGVECWIYQFDTENLLLVLKFSYCFCCWILKTYIVV